MEMDKPLKIRVLVDNIEISDVKKNRVHTRLFDTRVCLNIMTILCPNQSRFRWLLDISKTVGTWISCRSCYC